MLGKLIKPDIHEMLQKKQLREIREALMDFPPQELCELISELEDSEAAIVFRLLPRDIASDAFEYLSVESQQRLLKSFNQDLTRRIIQEMDPDDRTALLEELPARVTRKLLRLLTPDERQIAQELLAYPEDSVGRLMTPDYIDLRADMNAGEALDFIRRIGLDRETIYHCFVTRDGHVLEGDVELKDLVLAPADVEVGDLMNAPPRALVQTDTDQEEAAQILRDYDLLALPVIDNQKRLVGIITFDDIMDVMNEEATADMQVMAGVMPRTEKSYLEQRLSGISWRRGIPLIGLVVGQFMAGIVLSGFHHQLNSVIALAFFIPMVMATGGGMGIQTSTLIVRGLSNGEIGNKDFLRLLGREVLVCLWLGFVLALFAFGLAFLLLLMQQEAAPEGVPYMAIKVAITISLSLFCVMLISVVSGTILPLLFARARMDPAVMTSPFLTTTVDILGLLIYFLVANQVFGM